ncbi:uncharacterized protein N7482_004470 [Penicillium canariense]|uniref:Uncharacterized protein n=1 Tax=Penicillium canariense TaxID=189055 RepID=A0A9W9I6N7_9EURO|nr:uncharacterized protein N7482_004470 [Penicillium canariense]KAJ5168876.1 hypothetical protein N7482_004470 [Penicillium canariense]
MPELLPTSDNASVHSNTITSFSTAHQSNHSPPRQLRRRNTVTSITRWVSKRISRPSLTTTARGNELSEKNLNKLNKATEAEMAEMERDALDKSHTDLGTYSLVKGRETSVHPIEEIINEPRPEPDLEREREMQDIRYEDGDERTHLGDRSEQESRTTPNFTSAVKLWRGAHRAKP